MILFKSNLMGNTLIQNNLTRLVAELQEISDYITEIKSVGEEIDNLAKIQLEYGKIRGIMFSIMDEKFCPHSEVLTPFFEDRISNYFLTFSQIIYDGPIATIGFLISTLTFLREWVSQLEIKSQRILSATEKSNV
jgi:hypothetical protein